MHAVDSPPPASLVVRPQSPGISVSEVPRGGDLYLLKSVVCTTGTHSTTAVRILLHLSPSAMHSARVLLIERVVPEGF